MMANIWKNAVMGLVIGDALGMPVQFVDRGEIKKHPIEKMEGYGTYNMPPGTWSDDSSMAIATLVSLQEKNGIDYRDIMERFVSWTTKGEYTPAGKAFDQGNTCMEAIGRYMITKDYKTCGKTGERANGNGALMRIMPVCLYAYEKVKGMEWPVGKRWRPYIRFLLLLIITYALRWHAVFISLWFVIYWREKAPCRSDCRKVWMKQ